MTDLKERRQWVAMLAKLVCPTDPTGVAKALAAMLPMLADFPDGAFTMASLDHVAVKCRRTPSYAELREAIGEWWRDNRPEPLAIADDALAGLSERDKVWVTYWHERKRQGFPPIEGRPDVRDVKAHCASLVRQQSRAAWAVIERGENAA